ncbi:TetR/AcrR family transcriptional regulator [Microbacterium halophytorum]|uniref:TetR/AcrR family transcriptional regulator n=1 Tax=Microbacterium halophytorum TaxID=2067568 RepID=UPI00131A0EFA|nr:TetR/AcrR family transcriptional regulator [Microbacterium halophytorum]
MPEDDDAEPRPTGYSSGRATKKAIVASAATAFAQRGFYGTSLRSIAREAGVDHSTLLHHFGNKTALLLAVIEWHDQQQLKAAAPRSLSAEAIADAFTRTAASNQATPGLTQLLSILTAEAGAEGHPARATLQRRHGRIRTVLTLMIRRQRSKLDLPDDGLRPEERAALVIATWDGLQLYDALHPGELDIPALVSRSLREAFGLPVPTA